LGGGGQQQLIVGAARAAGLSHMSKELEEEVFSPSCEVHFAGDGFVVGMGAQDVEGDASEDGEVWGA
jgi:hypothetical protein